jgi:hypothetical protein
MEKLSCLQATWRGTQECVPIILPPVSAFERKKCNVVEARQGLISWYADNLAEYGKLWDPQVQ